MLSARLVHRVGDRAEEMSCGLLGDLQQDPRASEYHMLSHAGVRRRVFDREVRLRASSEVVVAPSTLPHPGGLKTRPGRSTT
jgi:hypothetical protein